MYCGQCGKKVMENMLFCPFCGSPIVIPDQDEDAAPQTAADKLPASPAEAPLKTEIAPDLPRSAPEANVGAPFKNESPAAEPVQSAPTIGEPVRDVQSAPTIGELVRDVQSAPMVGEPVRDVQSAQTKPVQSAPGRPVSLFDEGLPEVEPVIQPEAEDFVPLIFDSDGEIEDVKSEKIELDFPEQEIEDIPQTPRPGPRRPAPQAIRRPESARKRVAQTYIPVKEIDPDDMFLDGGDGEDDYDDFDDYDVDDMPPREYADSFEFEEPEYESFFQRHVRGVVGLVLLLVLLLVFTLWAFSAKGQLSLAKANLAWTAQPYADLGYEAYQKDSDLLAARYYEKALNLDEDNYEFAHSAMVAYYEAEKIDSAAAMLKKCIAMTPDSADPYKEMLILYPDAQSRPWEIQELIRQGYQRTGDPALNQAGA